MSRIQRWLLHLSLLSLTLSGGAYAVMKYLLVSEDPYSAAGHPLQPWALAVHVLSGPIAIFAVGLIFREHILARAPARMAGRGSGMTAALLLLPMTASGYLLETLTNEMLRKTVVAVHLGSGGLYAVCYLVHVLSSRLAPAGSPVKNGIAGRIAGSSTSFSAAGRNP